MSHRRDAGPIDCKVYVGDLGQSGTKHELERAFGAFGPLRNVWVARNPAGFAFVEFEDPRDARDAVDSLDGRYICGRRVLVEMSHGKKRSSRYRPAPPPSYRGGGGYDYPQRRRSRAALGIEPSMSTRADDKYFSKTGPSRQRRAAASPVEAAAGLPVTGRRGTGHHATADAGAVPALVPATGSTPGLVPGITVAPSHHSIRVHEARVQETTRSTRCHASG
ncbi:SRSF3 [Branchiostoma lanceolatum]|uniref:SRSF3 protein n=1 Tax=Branchiostoma lanceolatum TaxID=7740 RepID=A0A8J9ZMH7_BRALA|nr:SRSF3 [Branchiostoma lanceolatum]